MEMLIELIDGGHGYTLLPAMSALKIPADRRSQLKEIKSPIPTREVSLVYRRSQYKHNVLKAISESVKAHLPKEVYPKRNPSLSIIQIK
jgi:LysR family hydrogen peroxide-inducible transcriptional activator